MELMGEEDLRAYVEYFRDMGVRDFYRRGEPVVLEELIAVAEPAPVVASPMEPVQPVAVQQPRVDRLQPGSAKDSSVLTSPSASSSYPSADSVSTSPMPSSVARASVSAPSSAPVSGLVSFDKLAPLPAGRLAAEARPAALKVIQEEIGDCTRCPLAYAGRHTIVFGEGDPSARLMFVGEGPGADEDTSGRPFVGKAGQLLNNMIGAMGLKREDVYIANIVKCRPPNNRVPEPVEANTCSLFLVKQIDVVQPEVIVALGSTAATYLLGVKQSLAGLRGRWHGCRGAKLAVTYHPAFLLRDPRQKAEAWKDLQMVMKELGLKAPAKG
jgi:uracil-DNA glycosylase